MAMNLYEKAMYLYKFFYSFLGSWWASVALLCSISISLMTIINICVMVYRYKKGIPLRTLPGSAPRASDNVLRWGAAIIIVFGSTMGMKLVNRIEADYKQSIEHVSGNAVHTPQLMSLAKEMVQLIGLEASLTINIAKTASAAMANVRQNHPGLDEEAYQNYGDALRREMKEKLPEILEKISSLYAEQYTLEEFELLNAFYSSPLEKKGKQVDVAIGPEIFDITFMWSANASQKASEYLLQHVPPMSVVNPLWNPQGKPEMMAAKKEKEKKSLPDPEHLAAARAYLDSIGYGNTLDTTIYTILKLGSDAVKKAYPYLKGDVHERYVNILEDAMRKDMPDIMEAMVALYAGQYTLPEFREMTAFFNSPLGKKSKQVDSLLGNEVMEIVQKWALQAVKKATSFKGL